MCGIVGIVGPKAKPALGHRMLAQLAHRGPDSAGSFTADGVFLGHHRLSIIDLLNGAQPLKDAENTVALVCNGTIFNFAGLRRELQAAGHRFLTHSDCEVILHGYKQFGRAFFARLDGMFAFALFDSVKQLLILARDPFGIKPLHYHFDGANLRFGSEIKAIICDQDVPRHLDDQGFHDFLNVRFVPGTGTLFKDIHRLGAGNLLSFQGNEVSVSSYHELQPDSRGARTAAEFAEETRALLANAVQKQMLGDVPVAAYLSGGIDSSAIVGLMREANNDDFKTFALGFNAPTDELDDARRVAAQFGTDHRETRLGKSPLQSYPAAIWHAEEPKENILQGFLLSSFATSDAKLVLTGLGGDELFAGYNINRLMEPFGALHAFCETMAVQKILSPLSGLAYSIMDPLGVLGWDHGRRGLQYLLATGDPAKAYLILRNAWDSDAGAASKILDARFQTTKLEPVRRHFDPFFQDSKLPVMERVLRAEFHLKMVDDLLLNEDRMSMASGIEARVPFLDRDLVNLAFSMPYSMKVSAGQSKHVLRQALADLLSQPTLQKKKWGFTFDAHHLFNVELKRAATRILTESRVRRRGWFRYEYLEKIIHAPPSTSLRWHYFLLWMALGFEIWARMFIDNNGVNPELELEAYYE